MLIYHIGSINIKFQLLRRNIGLYDGFQVMHDFRERSFLLLYLHFTALNPAHIQHIIDQTEEMIAGRGNFPKIVLYLLYIINMSCSKRCESDNSVHWCPDIMGYIIQKRRLSPVGMLRHRQRILEINFLFLQLLFHLFLIINIHKKSHKSNRRAILPPG